MNLPELSETVYMWYHMHNIRFFYQQVLCKDATHMTLYARVLYMTLIVAQIMQLSSTCMVNVRD